MRSLLWCLVRRLGRRRLLLLPRSLLLRRQPPQSPHLPPIHRQVRFHPHSYDGHYIHSSMPHVHRSVEPQKETNLGPSVDDDGHLRLSSIRNDWRLHRRVSPHPPPLLQAVAPGSVGLQSPAPYNDLKVHALADWCDVTEFRLDPRGVVRRILSSRMGCRVQCC